MDALARIHDTNVRCDLSLENLHLHALGIWQTFQLLLDGFQSVCRALTAPSPKDLAVCSIPDIKPECAIEAAKVLVSEVYYSARATHKPQDTNLYYTINCICESNAGCTRSKGWPNDQWPQVSAESGEPSACWSCTSRDRASVVNYLAIASLS